MARFSQSFQARVSIDLDTLKRLLENRQVVVSELRCLDQESKQAIRQACLQSCIVTARSSGR